MHIATAKVCMAPAIATRMQDEGYHGGPDGAIDMDAEVGVGVVLPNKGPPIDFAEDCLQKRRDGPGYVELPQWIVTTSTVCPDCRTNHVNPNI